MSNSPILESIYCLLKKILAEVKSNSSVVYTDAFNNPL